MAVHAGQCLEILVTVVLYKTLQDSTLNSWYNKSPLLKVTKRDMRVTFISHSFTDCIELFMFIARNQ